MAPTKSIAELFDLSGRIAVVTGGALGIGAATAKRLAEAGAHVVLADINEEAAQRTAADVTSRGGKATTLAVDLENTADAVRMIESTVAEHGRVDILVNNAGVYPPTPVLEITEEQWDRVNNLNLKSAFFAAQAAAKDMVKRGAEGHIVNVASMDAFFATDQLAHYSASKAGMLGMSRTLALELAGREIRVNTLAPGSTLTEGGRVAGERFAAAAGMTAEDLIAAHAQTMPFGHLADPDDIATVVLFLVSDAATNITGAAVVADGGKSLHF